MGQEQKNFGEEGLKTWKTILTNHSATRKDQVVEIFHRGLEKLEIKSDAIPLLEEINYKLKRTTGFQGVFVEGLEEGKDFYKMLSEKKFPIGNFIRDEGDLNYTPAPDIIHDLYGHMPFFTDERYADFCQKFGEAAWGFFDPTDLSEQMEGGFFFPT